MTDRRGRRRRHKRHKERTAARVAIEADLDKVHPCWRLFGRSSSYFRHLVADVLYAWPRAKVERLLVITRPRTKR